MCVLQKEKTNQLKYKNIIGWMLGWVKNKCWSRKAVVDNLTHILILSLQPQGLETRKPTAG